MKNWLVAICVWGMAWVAWGVTPDTAALQAKIDAASALGGGRVTVPPGEYVVGSLKLKDGVELHLEKGALLLGALADADYVEYANPIGDSTASVIYADGAKDVSVTGEGVIDGRGGSLNRWLKDANGKGYWRKGRNILYFSQCRNVKIEGVTLRQPSSWTCFLRDCDGVVARKVTIFAHCNTSNDGFDVESSNVLIEDCDVDSEDDSLAIKSRRPETVLENIEVRRCRFSTNAEHIKFGTETPGTTRHVRIHDIAVECRTAPVYRPHWMDTPQEKDRSRWLNHPGVHTPVAGLSAIEISLMDGGILEDVEIKNITIGDGIITPIVIRHGNRTARKLAGESAMRNILLENIRMTKPSLSHIACSISTVPGMVLEDITLRNVDLLFKGGGRAADAAEIVKGEREKNYPLPYIFSSILPAYGFYLRHAKKGIVFENVRTRCLDPLEVRPAVMLDDSEITMAGCNFALPKGAPKTPPIVRRSIPITEKTHPDETAQWQGRIDAAHAAGGGVVEVPQGIHFVRRGLILKSNVTLHVAKDAVLVASTNAFEITAGALVYAANATNIAVVGAGVLDAQGHLWPRRVGWNENGREVWRKDDRGSSVIHFRACQNVRVEGVKLTNPASWTCFFNDCDGVVARKVRIWSHGNTSNDGMDIASRNVLIEDCDIDSEDDALVFKTILPTHLVENVEVRNCVLSSNSGICKFGTESLGTTRHIRIHDCELKVRTPILFRGAHNWFPGQRNMPEETTHVAIDGIELAVMDGGNLEDVEIRNIKMGYGILTPIVIRHGDRKMRKNPGNASLKNILLENIEMELPAQGHLPCTITGVPGFRPQDITLRNVSLIMRGGVKKTDVKKDIPERPKGYPGPALFGSDQFLPAWGFYIRHADNIQFENVSLKLAPGATDERPSIVREDVKGNL